MEKLSELNAVKAEIIHILDLATTGRVKSVLNSELAKINKEIEQYHAREQELKNGNEAVMKAPVKTNVEIKEHAFDESDKYVKIFIPFDVAATEVKEQDVELTMTEDSFTLLIHGAQKNHRFTVTSLLKKINTEKSYKKVKSDMIAIYLKKAKEGEKWSCLTRTEKQLKDQKTKMFEEKDGEEKDDPSSMLMNMMKKMYESGDGEMKRTIAKAWTEGQNKQRDMPLGPM